MSSNKELLSLSLRELLERIDDPRRDAILAFYDDNADIIHYAAGSSHNHQAWPGGYGDHIAEILRINEVTYDAMNALRPLDFSKASAAIVLFFHDLEKPYRYGPEGDARCDKARQTVQELMLNYKKEHGKNLSEYEIWEILKDEMIHSVCKKYGFELTAEEWNALEYAHGEGAAHEKFRRVSLPLAAHIHHCDNASARIWHDQGCGLSAPKPK
jgi:hypothetical protein